MQKTKSEMESFRKAQEIWKKKQREQVELENKKIQEYMFSKQSDIQASVLEKQQKEKAREEMVDKIARRIYEEKTRQKEREDIQQELLEQERLEAAELREHSDLEKRFRQRLEMTRGLDQQVQEHIQLRQEMAQQEAYYKNMIENNIKEGEKLEIMTAEKQRIKKVQLRKDLQELMAERRRKHAENMQIMQRLHEQEMEELAERNRKVEEERIRMLREHAEHLIGYMPKGLLREDDLPLLGKTVFDKYKSKKNTT
ncbi:hypothetical protein WA026_007466 [Henosepilachna vigintioctopunctata]|uniref:Meiosis-specific nuclear structural protein 1 n=1 Tax=Henosepilachna vigintioctopunctata TaxID=420089 RepID=A0AAW1UXR7_9CUCU